MIRLGENWIEGVAVDVERKRIRRINVRVKSDGRVHLSVPKWWGTLAEGEDFLRSKWDWVLRSRKEILSRPPLPQVPLSEAARARLSSRMAALHADWTVRLNEPNVSWKLRRMRTLWGSCHWRKRSITYSTELAVVPRELVEYVVVHELTHLQAQDHGPHFRALMDARLPEWKDLRRRLNRRQFVPETDFTSETHEKGEDMSREAKAEELFASGCNCAQSVFAAFADEAGLDEEAAKRISCGLGGGVGRMREVCGAVSAAAMVLGARLGSDKMAVYPYVQEFCAQFKAEFGSIVCHELLEGTGATIGGAPETRTKAYYEKRPCVELVKFAVRLLGTEKMKG